MDAAMNKLFSKKNVIGVGTIGKKVTKGKVTSVDALRVYVTKKEKVAKLKKGDKVDKYVNGVKTDLIEIGDIQIQVDRKSRVRLVKGGYSEGNITISAGTGGPLVKTTSQPFTSKAIQDEYVCGTVEPNTVYRLSNAHVYTSDTRKDVSKQIRAISQPGPVDDRVNIPENIVGRLESHVVIAPGKPVTVDAALRSCYSKESNVIEGIGVLDGFKDFIEGDSITKSGRTTQVSSGTVIDDSINLRINYGEFTGSLVDCYLTTYISAGGDSGSCAVKTGTKVCGGLVFAGSSTHSIVCKISNILKVWNLEVVKDIPTPPKPPLLDRIITWLINWFKNLFKTIDGK